MFSDKTPTNRLERLITKNKLLSFDIINKLFSDLKIKFKLHNNFEENFKNFENFYNELLNRIMLSQDQRYKNSSESVKLL